MADSQLGGYDPEALFKEQRQRFDDLEVPVCTNCGSSDTASVQVGVIGVTIRLASSCRKFHLRGGGPKPAAWYCHTCKQYFDVDDEGAEAGHTPV